MDHDGALASQMAAYPYYPPYIIPNYYDPSASGQYFDPNYQYREPSPVAAGEKGAAQGGARNVGQGGAGGVGIGAAPGGVDAAYAAGGVGDKDMAMAGQFIPNSYAANVYPPYGGGYMNMSQGFYQGGAAGNTGKGYAPPFNMYQQKQQYMGAPGGYANHGYGGVYDEDYSKTYQATGAMYTQGAGSQGGVAGGYQQQQQQQQQQGAGAQQGGGSAAAAGGVSGSLAGKGGKVDDQYSQQAADGYGGGNYYNAAGYNNYNYGFTQGGGGGRGGAHHNNSGYWAPQNQAPQAGTQ
jgi:hypothetical protein